MECSSHSDISKVSPKQLYLISSLLKLSCQTSTGFLIPQARLSYSLALSTQSLQHKLSQPWISVIHKVLTRDDTPTRYDRGFVSVQYNMWRLTLTRGFVEISIFNQYSRYPWPFRFKFDSTRWIPISSSTCLVVTQENKPCTCICLWSF